MANNRTHPYQRISGYIETMILLLWGIFFLIFPLFFLVYTTDAFILPKQMLLVGVTIISLLLWGAKMILDGKTKLRRTPFDFPIILFVVFVFLSSLFAVNRTDSLISFVPLLCVFISYIIIVNVFRKEQPLLFLLSALVAGGCILAVFTILNFFKIYLLPFAFAHNQTFTPIGSQFDQALYLVFVLPIASYFFYHLLKGQVDGKTITFSVASGILGLGLVITIVQLLTMQKPVLLPFETGFQTAFAAISQDTRRIAQGFFFGSGYGTFFTDFTRFKQAPFNLNQNIWFLTFLQSSSFMLELLATTGLLGILSFLFLIAKIVKKPTNKLDNPAFFSIITALIIAFIFPFSFTHITILFLIIGLYASIEALIRPKQFFDIEIHLVTLKRGLISLQTESSSHHVSESERGFTKIIPITFFIIFLIFSVLLGWYGTRYVLSDMAFQKSLIAASNNNGTQTYQEQINAISLFPYRDVYYRVFSQTNLALANSLATTKGQQLAKDPSAQRTLYALIQQSINAARNATILSPQTAVNWQNLGAIYRALIGFGQNAENFSILATQQAVALDGSNPQEYIILGGIYYQLGQYDNAIREFQTAASLKQDYPNAYYNLGHALEQKGDLKAALAQYQVVQTLVVKDPNNSKKITDEIAALQGKISTNSTASAPQVTTPTPTPPSPPTTEQRQLPLDIAKPSTQLPQQKPPVKIPPPPSASESGR